MVGKVVVRLLLIGMGLSGVVFLGEFICRIFVPKVVINLKARCMYSDMLLSHPALRRVLRPNYSGRIVTNEIDFKVKTNSNGLRDREFSYDKPKDTIRILVLGDSLTFGYGVKIEKTYPKLLEGKFRSKFLEKKIEVINAGIPGWGTSQERDYLKIEGIKFNPDLILVGFYFNDVQETYEINIRMEDNISRWEREDASTAKFAQDKPMVKMKIFLKKHSYFLMFLNDRISSFIDRLDKRADVKNIKQKEPEKQKKAQNQFSEGQAPGDIAKDPYSLYRRTYKANTIKAWTDTINLLADMHKIGKDIGAKVVFIYLPSEIETVKLKIDDENVVLNKPESMFVEWAGKNNFYFIDLLPRFKNSKISSLYLKDGHFNENGGSVAAEGIFEWLIANKGIWMP